MNFPCEIGESQRVAILWQYEWRNFRFWSISPACRGSNPSILISMNAPGIAEEGTRVFDSKFEAFG